MWFVDDMYIFWLMVVEVVCKFKVVKGGGGGRVDYNWKILILF